MKKIALGAGVLIVLSMAGFVMAQGFDREGPIEPKFYPKGVAKDLPPEKNLEDKREERVEEKPQMSTWTQAKIKKKYVWLKYTKDLPKLKVLREHLSPPLGYTRVKIKEGSYADYLRHVPVRQDRTNTLLYNGSKVYMPSVGVVPLDLGPRDLHQCADSVMRLHAEYLWSSGKSMKAQYHYTSGDLARWKDWRKGKVLAIKKGKVVTKKVAPWPQNHKAYRRFMDKVFTYASTRSMHRDAKVIKDLKSIQAGDFFLTPGSPGHVVMVMDIAENDAKERVALIGQGYIPAREFHILKGSRKATVGGIWYKLPSKKSDRLVTPTWSPFKTSELKRFKTL